MTRAVRRRGGSNLALGVFDGDRLASPHDHHLTGFRSEQGGVVADEDGNVFHAGGHHDGQASLGHLFSFFIVGRSTLFLRIFVGRHSILHLSVKLTSLLFVLIIIVHLLLIDDINIFNIASGIVQSLQQTMPALQPPRRLPILVYNVRTRRGLELFRRMLPDDVAAVGPDAHRNAMQPEQIESAASQPCSCEGRGEVGYDSLQRDQVQALEVAGHDEHHFVVQILSWIGNQHDGYGIMRGV
mmetsp:Transcript_9954/g.20992  ORF Transcript_9954/g.20992 Transcript_9954/m.20992 type:complete len:241 (-) Transcript_9954:560-1282(-)